MRHTSAAFAAFAAILGGLTLSLSLIPRADATNVGMGVIEQPVNLGARSDPAAIPLGPVAMESNYNYGIHDIITSPRPCLHGAMEWKGGTELDQNLAHVFGIAVEPEDTTQVPYLPVVLRVKSRPVPAYSPYTREQVMAATLHCLLRSTNPTPKYPLKIKIVTDDPADKSWAEKFAGDYVNRPDTEGQPVEPTPVPGGGRIETDAMGIARLVFPGVTKTAATPSRPPVLVPTRLHGGAESDRDWMLLPVWAGDTFENPLDLLGQRHRLYYDRFNPATFASPDGNALFEGSSWLTWSIREAPGETTAHLTFGTIDPENLAAFLHAVVLSVRPVAEKPLIIRLMSSGDTPDYFQQCLDAGGWKIEKNPNNESLAGTFILDPKTNELVKGSIPGVTLVRGSEGPMRLTVPEKKDGE
ncbi:hypothetical protein OKA04_20830 [Luteolibacter flavescens]|uniref:Uncharacterized protein n=1 Tax=Luteolibacter flavescens TaxID=1859460 RepID=A0ABT3FVD4_9BACT|nr:hypothetical protein [Luteolibacter flavescens]MCW1887196.1 hypothetical protein [Luteolibacter flavescens]